MRLILVGIVLIVLVLGGMGQALAWGPHPQITRAALQVIPDAARWRPLLGAEYDKLTGYAWMPDQAGLDFSDYYPDDYLLIRGIPRYSGHGMPLVERAWEPFFRRSLQALRTESPTCACRQLGALLHYVEDTGAPPHARLVSGPLHGPLENWLKASEISIDGYQPRLLGADEQSAITGLQARMQELVAYSIIRVDRAEPLAREGETARTQIEPILLESALEAARTAADVLHTLFTLADAPLPPGAELEGTVTAPDLHPGVPRRNGKGARIVLLEDARYRALGANPASLADALTDYATIALTSASPTQEGWVGKYSLRNLPAGVYRVLAFRTGSQVVISAPVKLEVGKTATLNLNLPAGDPPHNLLQNPTGTLSYLEPGPDRWQRSKTGWISRGAQLEAGWTYRCGAVLKDPTARVTFTFAQGVRQGLPAAVAGAAPPEVTYPCVGKDVSAAVFVETTRPLTEVLECVWVVPVAPTAPAAP